MSVNGLNFRVIPVKMLQIPKGAHRANWNAITKRDHKTRRYFFVFKSKQNRQWKEILQDMQT